jgi:hypothetical protein
MARKRADDYEKHVQGSDKRTKPVGKGTVTAGEKKEIAQEKKDRKTVKKAASKKKAAAKPSSGGVKAAARKVLSGAKKVGKKAFGLKGTALLVGGTYIGSKIMEHKRGVDKGIEDMKAAGKSQRAESSPSPTSAPASKPASSAPPKKGGYTGKSVRTKGGDYPVFKKGSDESSDFKSAFAAARKAGKDTFTWQGRKYNTKTK